MRRSAVIRLARWWPVPVAIAVAVVAQRIVVGDRYDVSGHAGGHLEGGSVVFPAFALVAILLYVTPPARKQLLVLLAGACWLASTVLVYVGNLRVVDALVDAGMAHTPSSELVETSTVEAAHDLANLAPFIGVVTAVALVGALWMHRHVTPRVAIGAVVLSVLFPPWIFPGFGVLVVVVARCVAFHRATKTDGHQPASADVLVVPS